MMRSLWVAGGLALSGSLALFAQVSSFRPSSTFWVSGGVGGSSEGVGGLLEAAAQIGPHQISLRAIGMTDLYDDAVWDLGVLYSRSRWTRRGHLSAGVGLAEVGLDPCGEIGGCTGVVTGVGIPVMVRAMWRPVQGLGLGGYGFGNVNTVRSFAGLALMLTFGKVQ